jgi:hypothetical protein
MKKFLLIIQGVLLSFALYSQPIELEWQACFGTNLKEVVSDVCPTGDGYIIVAEGNTDSPRGIDIFVIRTDLSGNAIWEKYLGGNSSDGVLRILSAGNDSYYISAISGSVDGDISFNPFPDGLSNYWIIKINGSGDIIWDKMYGGNCFERGWDACLTHDGGMVSLGYTCSEDGDISNYYGMWDTWLLRTDSLGNKVWDFTIGTEFLDFPNAIIQTSDKGFLVSSGSMPTTGGNITCTPYDLIFSDIVLFKIDSLANIEWQNCIGGGSDESVKDIIEVEDGYMLACYVYSGDGDMTGSGFHYGTSPQGNVLPDIWLVKIDFDGNIQWQKCYGGTAFDVPNSIFPTNDGGYIVVAETESNDGDVSGKHHPHGYFSDIWVFKINATGDLLWQKCVGGLGYERLDWSGVIDNGDGSYVIASTMDVAENAGDITCVSNYGSMDIWLIQLRDTTVVSSNHFPKPEYSVKAYPNPANDYVVFELQKSLPSGTITISDITGRQVASMPITGEKTVWQPGIIPSGVYLYRIEGATTVASGKLVILNE